MKAPQLSETWLHLPVLGGLEPFKSYPGNESGNVMSSRGREGHEYGRPRSGTAINYTLLEISWNHGYQMAEAASEFLRANHLDY